MSSNDSLSSEFTIDTDPEIASNIVQSERQQAKYGLICGVSCIFLGILLLVLGIPGSIDWSFKSGIIESSLKNAAPGIVLFIVGFLIIAATKFNITIKK